MNPDRSTDQPAEREASDFRLYLVGLLASLALTALAFAAVMYGEFGRSLLFWSVSLAALVQLLVQLRCFLHIDLQKSHRDDLQLILFTSVLAAIMIGGTIWITADQMGLMG